MSRPYADCGVCQVSCICSPTKGPVKTDMKEALGSLRKPDITHVRKAFAVYTARGCMLGDHEVGGKYERSNYLRPTGAARHTTPSAADVRRFRVYLRGAMSHIMETLDALERHQAGDPHLEDVEGFTRAVYAPDLDDAPGFGPSKLAHVALACSSLQMAIVQAVECGLLPEDPGAPWAKEKTVERRPMPPINLTEFLTWAEDPAPVAEPETTTLDEEIAAASVMQRVIDIVAKGDPDAARRLAAEQAAIERARELTPGNKITVPSKDHGSL